MKSTGIACHLFCLSVPRSPTSIALSICVENQTFPKPIG